MAITADYYQGVTRELEKAARTYQAEIEIYQRDGHYTDLSALYSELGQYEKALEVERQRQRLVPNQGLAWKDADPDIPILKQAKAEYAKLQ
jgi:hypothetical protein